MNQIKLLVVSLLILVSAYNYSQSQPIQLHQDSLLTEVRDLIFLNDSVGLACGAIQHGEGFVLKTINAGDTWFDVQADVQILTSIVSLNDSTIIGCGQDGAIYKSFDYGNSWDYSSQIGGLNDISDMLFLNDSIGFSVVLNQAIYKTLNAGINWEFEMSMDQTIDTDDSRKNNALFFLNDSIGYAVHFGIFKTIDGGESWTILAQNQAFHYNSIYMIDEMNGFIVGKLGLFGKTTDGWFTFEQSNISSQHLRDLHFLDENKGITIGGGENYYWPSETPNDTSGVVLFSNNAGESWSEIEISDTRLYSMTMHNSDLFVTGAFGEIYKFEGIEDYITSATQLLDKNNPLLIYPNPASHTLNILMPSSQYSDGLKILIRDLFGNIVFEKDDLDNNSIHTFRIDHLNSGLYILYFEKDREIFYSSKFIKY